MSPDEFNFMNQLPGLALAVDFNQFILGGNEFTAKILGFKNMAEAMGVSIFNFPCKVSEYADVFEKQNQNVINTTIPQRILDIHPFAHDEMKAFLVYKSRFVTPKNETACLILGSEIKKSTLLQISLNLVKTDRKYRGMVSNNSYVISEDLNNIKLSARELECLFYLVRGKTSADIALCMRLSKRTVESYIDNIKIKMNCLNKAALIEKAIENNFIDFIPEKLLTSQLNHISLEID